MRPITTLALAATSLSGCAQIGSAADTLWGGTKSAAKWVSSPVRSLLRDAPEEEYSYADAAPADADVVVYADGSTGYAPRYEQSYEQGYQTSYAEPSYAPAPSAAPAYSAPTYSTGQYYTAEADVPTANFASADTLAFVRLNGESDMNDWRNCETVHRGYWLFDAAGGRINPDFEVCMRNKGYVLESELAIYGLRDSTAVRGQDSFQAPIQSAWATAYRPLP